MTNDPYQVLGISPSASPEEVREVYLDLVRRYHPDNYQDEYAKTRAQEKMNEINEAYDAITHTGQEQADRPHNAGQQAGKPWDSFFGSDWTNRRPNQEPASPYYRGSACGDDLCGKLSCLCLADSCCECCGGDLVPCC